MTVDADGNLFIAETFNHIIRKVATNGTISTVAGYGSIGDTGDGGPATSAQLGYPIQVAVDANRNLYILDMNSLRIRKIGTNGSITTVAGNGSMGYSGDGGPATNAQLSIYHFGGVAVDATGNLYISDGRNYRIRRVATNGIITTVAGGSPGYFGDGGPATSAGLGNTWGVAMDATANLYIADSNRIRKVATNGIITTVAGNGSKGYSGDGGPATSAQLNSPSGIAVDANGNLYISDLLSNRIRKVGTNGLITTIAGNGSGGYSGDGGPATNAQLANPNGVAVDAMGNLYIADSNSQRIRKVATNGIITTVAGSSPGGYSGDGGPATRAQLAYPTGVAVDVIGNLYIADSSNRIRKVTTNGIITTLAGTGAIGHSGDGGPATSAELADPTGIAADAAGIVYFTDTGNNAIRMLRPVASVLTASTLANAASNLTGPVSPGEIVVLYGSGIGPAQLVQARVDDQGRYGTTLAGTRVLFNGTPAPMLYSWTTQTSAIVPYNLSGTTASVQIEYQGAKTDPMTVLVAASAPGVFTLDASGKGQAAAINEDGSLNTASRPAKAGSIVSLYATGEGQTTPAGRDGEPIAPPLPTPVLRVQVTIDGKPAEVLYAGGAPGIVAGLMQINARIPANARAGAAPLVVTVGSVSSQSGVTIAVAGN